MFKKLNPKCLFFIPLFVIAAATFVQYTIEYWQEFEHLESVHEFYDKYVVIAEARTSTLDAELILLLNSYEQCDKDFQSNLRELKYSRHMLTEIAIVENGVVICGDQQGVKLPVKLSRNIKELQRAMTDKGIVLYRYSLVNNKFITFSISFRELWMSANSLYIDYVKVHFEYNDEFLIAIDRDKYYVTEPLINEEEYTPFVHRNNDDSTFSMKIYYPNINITKISNNGIFRVMSITLLSLVLVLFQYRKVASNLGNQINAAYKNKEFIPHFQPIVNLETTKWVGAEALIRWYKDGKIYKSPDQFIPFAEKNRMSSGFQDICIENSLSLLECLKKDEADFFVSINVSPNDLENQHVDHIGELKKASKILPRLEFEITERGINLKIMKKFSQMIKKIHSFGFSVSLDDFGTGQAGLSYINSLHFNKIKIDKKFVDAINQDTVDFHILTTIIELATKLDVEIVAEGVETEEQKEWLISHGIYLAQGWLFSKDLTYESFISKFNTQT